MNYCGWKRVRLTPFEEREMEAAEDGGVDLQ